MAGVRGTGLLRNRMCRRHSRVQKINQCDNHEITPSRPLASRDLSDGDIPYLSGAASRSATDFALGCDGGRIYSPRH